jgi:hypothetical protein
MSQNQAAMPEIARYQRLALIVGAVALLLCAIGAFIDTTAFFQAYLVAFLYWLAFPLGALAIVAVYHLSGGVWGLGIRRPLEAAMTTIPVFLLLFVPLIFGMETLYPWTHETDAILEAKSPYLNVPFWLARVVLYFLVWGGITWLLYYTSRKQDRTGDPDLPRLLGRRSRFSLAFYVLTISFAAIDWAMSLDPHWFSTIYGMLFIAGQGLTGIAFSIVVLRWLSQRSPIDEVTTPSTFNDLGNLLLAFVMIWTYMNLSQYLIIWAANLPEEVTWYLRRMEGGWQIYTVLLFLLQFALPFVTLLARDNKRNGRTLARLAIFVLVMRLLDIYWIVMPEVRHDGLSVSWLDIVAPIGIGGIWIAVFLWRLQHLPLLPLHDHRDPRLRPAAADHGHADAPRAGDARA